MTIYTNLFTPPDKQAKRYRRFNFLFDNFRYDTIYRLRGYTPYHLKEGFLYYNNEILDSLPFSQIDEIGDYWGSEGSWYFKEVPSLHKHYDLRLNPINECANLNYQTGFRKEFRGCVFCQRCYTAPRLSEKRCVVSVANMFEEIFKSHGSDILREVHKVLFITGEPHTEQALMKMIHEIYYEYLIPNGFNGYFSAVTTAIRTSKGISSLSKIDNTIFEFPIECFTNREVVLGAQKGIPLSTVKEILSKAREHFKYIRINYVLGLESINEAEKGFAALSEHKLVDDVVSNFFVPYSLEAEQFRVIESFEMEYIYHFRKVMQQLGLVPKKTGVTKDVFSHLEKSILSDELMP